MSHLYLEPHSSMGGALSPETTLLGVNSNSATYMSWPYVLRPLCVNLKDEAILVLFPGWVGRDPECLLFDQLL